MSRETPWLLHLSRRALLRGTGVSTVAQSRGDLRSPSELERRFGMYSQEARFAADLVRSLPQLWVFRCDQLRSCGDFLLVDMSSRLTLRRCAVIEHKQRTPLRPSRHRQLANHAAAVDELVRRGVVDGRAAVAVLLGSAEPRVLAGVAGLTTCR